MYVAATETSGRFGRSGRNNAAVGKLSNIARKSSNRRGSLTS
ncbi:hypothetical protein SAMN05444172_1700 [Burkholderia sp. GAS332]|nr:hypothetical protein SAMN05444172_1700 [Burkholderia sp. GAS332]